MFGASLLPSPGDDAADAASTAQGCQRARVLLHEVAEKWTLLDQGEVGVGKEELPWPFQDGANEALAPTTRLMMYRWPKP